VILLLGGTADSAPLAHGMVDAGETVLVCSATDLPLPLPAHPRVQRRCGRLDRASLLQLLAQHPIDLIVDGTHPYAEAITALAQSVAAECGVEYLAYQRPSAITGSTVRWVAATAPPRRWLVSSGAAPSCSPSARHT
jgi:precorrin-6A/cobalt-precorrin-6A reductase